MSEVPAFTEADNARLDALAETFSHFPKDDSELDQWFFDHAGEFSLNLVPEYLLQDFDYLVKALDKFGTRTIDYAHPSMIAPLTGHWLKTHPYFWTYCPEAVIQDEAACTLLFTHLASQLRSDMSGNYQFGTLLTSVSKMLYDCDLAQELDPELYLRFLKKMHSNTAYYGPEKNFNYTAEEHDAVITALMPLGKKGPVHSGAWLVSYSPQSWSIDMFLNLVDVFGTDGLLIPREFSPGVLQIVASQWNVVESADWSNCALVAGAALSSMYTSQETSLTELVPTLLENKVDVVSLSQLFNEAPERVAQYMGVFRADFIEGPGLPVSSATLIRALRMVTPFVKLPPLPFEWLYEHKHELENYHALMERYVSLQADRKLLF